MENKEKKKCGGYRVGSGKKPIYNSKINVHLKLDEDLYPFYKEHDNKNRYLNNLIRDDKEKKEREEDPILSATD